MQLENQLAWQIRQLMDRILARIPTFVVMAKNSVPNNAMAVIFVALAVAVLHSQLLMARFILVAHVILDMFRKMVIVSLAQVHYAELPALARIIHHTTLLLVNAFVILDTV